MASAIQWGLWVPPLTDTKTANLLCLPRKGHRTGWDISILQELSTSSRRQLARHQQNDNRRDCHPLSKRRDSNSHCKSCEGVL